VPLVALGYAVLSYRRPILLWEVHLSLMKRVSAAFRPALIACLAMTVLTPTVARASVVPSDPPPPAEAVGLELLTAGNDGNGEQEGEESAFIADMEALEVAREQGPEAAVALLDTLRGPALDAVMDEIQEAQEELAQTAHPAETGPVSEDEERAAMEVQIARDARARARALGSVATDPVEGKRESDNAIRREGDKAIRRESDKANQRGEDSTAPVVSTEVTRTVGSGCEYATIGAAVAAANPDDTLLLEGGRTFYENLTIPIGLTLRGGYDGCGSGLSDPTTIDGGASDRVIEVDLGLDVTLENLNITNGNTGGDGGGVSFAGGAGTGNLTLTNVAIYGNRASWGGGLWVGMEAEVHGTDVQIYDNTAGDYGGGVRLYGGCATFENSTIHDNAAPQGAGVYGTEEGGHSPVLNLPTSADLHDNQALTDDGFGGGLYLRQGSISLAGCSDVYSNEALAGGGVYLITSTLTVDGSCSEINYNTSTGHGGGVYAQSSTVNLDEDAEIEYNAAGTGGSGSGGGAYLDASSLYSDKASINNNTASSYGGGVYAVNGSRLDMDLGSYICLGPRCSRVYNNVATGGYGGGVYLNDSTAWLDNTFVENNWATVGGGLYAYQSNVYGNSVLFARNDSTSGTGDGIRLYTGATMAGQGNTFAYNESGGGSTGRAIDLSSAELTLSCSIIWGHASSVDKADQNVTYSDVQGGYAGSGNLNVDPQFVASGSADYHLQSSSPVIDRCVVGPSTDFDYERRPIVQGNPGTPYDMGADEFSTPRVGINGSGCIYGTIQQAVNGAGDGDTLQIAEGVHFENVDIQGKDVTLNGGYDDADCTTAGAGATRVDGSLGSGSTFDVDDATVTLGQLGITGGSGTGGGVATASYARVTLDSTDVYENHGTYGGGVYVGTTSAVTLTNGSSLHDNTATLYGGGARVWGTLRSLDTSSDIDDNAAAHGGGGVSVMGGTLHLIEADLSGNQATAADGRGGAILLEDGAVLTMTGNVWLYDENEAYDGAGIYADDARVFLGTATVGGNRALHRGGGVCLMNDSTLSASSAKVGSDVFPFGNEAVIGAGIYAITSTVSFEGTVYNNLAANAGAGIYARASTVNLTDAHVGGTDANQPNRLDSGGHLGAGLYLADGTRATIDNTVVAGNAFTTADYTYGGGLYAIGGSVVTMTASSVENHLAPSATDGRGAGVYVSESTVTLDDSRVISNTAGTAGGGIRLYDSGTLNVRNDSRIVNNHALNGIGGGIAASGALDVNVADTTLRSNTAATDGGAIYVDGGTLDFTGGWTLRENQAGGNGGAVAVVGTAEVNFRAGAYSLAYANRSLSGHGGMLYLGNGTTTRLYATDGHDMYVYANRASEDGGALYADNGGIFDIYGQVNFDRNRADNGGAVFVSNGARVWFDDYVDVRPQLWDNWADSGSGGAVYAANSPRVECDGATFGQAGDGNQASVSGGAIYLSGSGLSADNCVFQANRAAQHGGAIAAYTSTVEVFATYTAPVTATQGLGDERGVLSPAAAAATACDPRVEQCSAFYDNAADSDGDDTGLGGALYTNEGSTQIRHTHLHNNSGVRGGAIQQVGSNAVANVADTLVYGNTATSGFGAGIRSEGGAFTVTHVTLANNVDGAGYSQSNTVGYVTNSIAWGNAEGGFWITSGPLDGTCNIDQSGNVGASVDPEFVDAGAGEDYRLRSGSPAIDACVTGLSPDLHGGSRPYGDAYDMGAHEYALWFIYLPLVLQGY